MHSIYQKFFSIIRDHFLIASVLAIAVLYLPLLKAYFQQDEWFAFGYFFSNAQNGLVHLLKLAFAPNVGHFTPFYYLSFYALMYSFGVNYQAFLATSFIWHVAIFALLYRTIKVLTSNKVVASLTSIFFLFAASSSQATSWVVADTNTHGSTFFGILALYLTILFLKSKKSYYNIILPIASILISLFFKEVTIGLFGSVVLLVLIIESSIIRKKAVVITAIVSAFLYLFLRGIMILLPKTGDTAPLITQTQTVGLLFYNAITFPAKAFFQAFLPTEFWVKIGRIIGRVLPHQFAVNTSQFSTSVNEKILEPLFILFFICLCLFTYSRYRRLKTFETKIMLWSLLFVIFNSIIYAFSPERTGIITFLDSRNLYFTSIGSFLWLFAFLYTRIQKKNIIALLIVGTLFTFQIIYLKAEFTVLVQSGMVRQTILNEIFRKMPILKNNTVIYVESDTPYYGLSSEHATPPFQSGVGHTLLVLYTKDFPYPADFYAPTFLWPLSAEGYLSKADKSFGYFSKLDSLLLAVKKYDIPVENVYAFSWQGGTESLLDITDQTRITIKNQNAL